MAAATMQTLALMAKAEGQVAAGQTLLRVQVLEELVLLVKAIPAVLVLALCLGLLAVVAELALLGKTTKRCISAATAALVLLRLSVVRLCSTQGVVVVVAVIWQPAALRLQVSAATAVAETACVALKALVAQEL